MSAVTAAFLETGQNGYGAAMPPEAASAEFRAADGLHVLRHHRRRRPAELARTGALTQNGETDGRPTPQR
jgi:hypothetical protein